jgi:hypothetical protein
VEWWRTCHVSRLFMILAASLFISFSLISDVRQNIYRRSSIGEMQAGVYNRKRHWLEGKKIGNKSIE